MKLGASLILLLGLSVSAHAEGTVVILSCHRTTIRDAHGLDKVPLDGVIVRPAVKERCTGDDKSVEVNYYSLVYLTSSGICKFAAYDAQHGPTGTILRATAERSRCPAQNIAKYAQTEKLSDAEYLAIARYWKSLQIAPNLLTDKIVRNSVEPPEPHEEEAASAFKQHIMRDLRSGMAQLEYVRPLTDDELSELAPRHRTTRAYHVSARGGYETTLIPQRDGFEAVNVGQAIP